MRSKYEIRAQKELEEEGYLVDYKIRPRFTPRHYKTDFLGLFDLLAIKDGEFRMIAIKGLAGNRHIIKKEIEAVKFPESVIRELWHVNNKGQWIKEILR